MEQFEKNLSWFLDPVKHHYFDFEGRVTRQTFWMFTLWYVIIYIVLSIFSDMLASVFSLAVLLPSIGLGARRLHDIGMSGWWQLIGIIPVLGWVAIIYLLAKQGQAGPNEYGTDPRSGAVSPVPPAPTAATTHAAQVSEGQTTPIIDTETK